MGGEGGGCLDAGGHAACGERSAEYVHVRGSVWVSGEEGGFPGGCLDWRGGRGVFACMRRAGKNLAP